MSKQDWLQLVQLALQAVIGWLALIIHRNTNGKE